MVNEILRIEKSISVQGLCRWLTNEVYLLTIRKFQLKEIEHLIENKEEILRIEGQMMTCQKLLDLIGN